MSWGNSGSDCTQMYYRPRLKEYRNDTGLHRFDHQELVARSFGEVYLKRDGKKLLLNESAYAEHVRQLKEILKSLKIRYVALRTPGRYSYSTWNETRCTLLNFKQTALPILYRELFQAEGAYKYAVLQKRHEHYRKYSLETMKSARKQIAELRKLGARMNRAAIKKLRQECLKAAIDKANATRQRRSDAAKRAAESRRLMKNSWKHTRPVELTLVDNGVNNEDHDY